MKKLAILCVFFITCLLLTPALAKELRIGVVDIEGIMSTSPDYKRIEGSLKKKQEELGRPLQQREQELSQQLQEYQKQAQAGIIKEDVKKQKESELQKKFEDIQKSKDTAAHSFQEYYQGQLKPLMEKLNKTVDQVAGENNLDLVLAKGAVVVLRDKSLDITDKVRDKFK